MLCFSQRDNVPGGEYTGTELPTNTNQSAQMKRMAVDTPRHHNPHDSWSSKDLLLAFLPAVIAYAFRVSTAFTVGTFVTKLRGW